MATTITPNLHLTEAIPGSNEPFSTAVVNANWDAIDAFAGTTNTRVTALETWRTTTTPNLLGGLVVAGSSTARDAYWGVPATATDRVALANKGARWFNTDNGMAVTETYFAQTGDSGSVLPTAAAAGWYPEPGTLVGYSSVAGGQVLSTTALTVITSLTTPSTTLKAIPYLIELDASLLNPNAGADSRCALQIYEDGVAIGTVRQFNITFQTGQAMHEHGWVALERTPTAGAHVYTARAQTAVANSVTISDAFLRISTIVKA